MKKAILLAAALCLAAAPAFANSLYFSWNNCNGDANATQVAGFDCANFAISSAYITYRLDASTPNIIAVSGGVDFAVENSPDLPQFWHFEPGGCNASGIGIDHARSNTPCTNTGGVPTFAGVGGTNAQAFIVARIPGINGPNRMRILWAVVRASSNPATLAGGTTRQFACELNFFPDNATEAGGTCDGCSAPLAMVLNWILLESPAQAGGDVTAATISSTDPGSEAITLMNGATNGAVVPTRNRTWGQVKGLYR
jgi:hypothetical protein